MADEKYFYHGNYFSPIFDIYCIVLLGFARHSGLSHPPIKIYNYNIIKCKL